MESLLNSMLDYAVDKEYIAINKARSVSRPSDNKFRIPETKPTEEIVYTELTKKEAIRNAEELFERTGNTAYLAVCLNFTLGLRVGEVVALETTDINGNTIHIGKEEIHNIVEDEKNVSFTNVVQALFHTLKPLVENEIFHLCQKQNAISKWLLNITLNMVLKMAILSS